LFERETGKPVFPIEEKAVPTETSLVGEKLAPTQPIPTNPKPFVRQLLTEQDLNDLIPDSSYQDIKSKFASYKKGNMFTGTLQRRDSYIPGLRWWCRMGRTFC
jgi:quinoprotein glucose dehydrogenase